MAQSLSKDSAAEPRGPLVDEDFSTYTPMDFPFDLYYGPTLAQLRASGVPLGEPMRFDYPKDVSALSL